MIFLLFLSPKDRNNYWIGRHSLLAKYRNNQLYTHLAINDNNSIFYAIKSFSAASKRKVKIHYKKELTESLLQLCRTKCDDETAIQTLVEEFGLKYEPEIIKAAISAAEKANNHYVKILLQESLGGDRHY